MVNLRFRQKGFLVRLGYVAESENNTPKNNWKFHVHHNLGILFIRSSLKEQRNSLSKFKNNSLKKFIMKVTERYFGLAINKFWGSICQVLFKVK